MFNPFPKGTPSEQGCVVVMHCHRALRTRLVMFKRFALVVYSMVRANTIAKVGRFSDYMLLKGFNLIAANEVRGAQAC